MHLLARLTQAGGGVVRVGGGRGEVAWFAMPGPDRTTFSEDAAMIAEVDEHRLVLAVADGVGGQAAGALAAEMLMETIQHSLVDIHARGESVRGAVLNGLETANQLVTGLGLGAATTFAGLEIDGKNVRPYHIGDSQIVVSGQKGHIRLETMAHSPVGYAVQAGLLDAREAIHHEDRHLVSNIVGSTDMRIEIGSMLRLRPRDTVLLATDGLFDNLHLAEIIEIMRKGPLDRAAETLATLARARMDDDQPGHPSKPDDLTLLLYRPQSSA